MALAGVVTIATICLLNGPEYEHREYVLAQLVQCPRQAQLIVLPHMPFLSFDTATAEADLKPFADFARERQAYLALSLTEKEGDDTYFTAVLFAPSGEIAGRYRKAHALIDDDISLGDELPVFETSFGALAMTIGSDFYFPEVYEVLRMKGADIITWHHYPERLRDHSGWEPLLTARCADSHVHIVTAMYADEHTYLTHNYAGKRQGAALGRSMVLNRVGTPVADTGYEDGIAMATVNLGKRKKNFASGHLRTENVFLVINHGDRKALAPIAEPYSPPELPTYRKRTCRLAVGHFDRSEIWRDGKVPETMLRVIDMAAAVKPDLLLLSEQSCKAADETTKRVMEIVAEKAVAMNCHIAIGGIANYGHNSVCHVWDRTGKLVYGQALYWFQGFEKLEVFDADFGRVASHTCGDLYTQLFDRVLALKGAEIIIDPSQMSGPDGRYNETMLRARAIDNAAWVACAHWTTSDPSLRSVIVDPYGQVVAASGFNREHVIYYDIDLDEKRVYYSGLLQEQAEHTEEGMGVYAFGTMPEQQTGWREVLFAARRPELYGIIPTVNEVIMRYRPEQ